MNTIKLNNNLITFDHIGISEKQFTNLKTLCARKKGELLISREGTLVNMSILERLHLLISSTYRNKVNSELKNSITDLTQSLNINENNCNFITELFFEKLNHLSRNIYSRDLNEHTFTYLSNQISTESNIPEYLKPTAKAATLFAKMGNFESGTGCSASYQIIQGKIGTQNSKTLGIFKPSSGDTLGSENPKIFRKIMRKLNQIIPKYLIGNSINTVAGQAYASEVATNIVENYVTKKAGLQPNSLVPETFITKMQVKPTKGDEIGSFQLWIQEEHQNAQDALNSGFRYTKGLQNWINDIKGKKITQPTKEQFELMVIIDFLTGNNDRHGENWFILPDGRIKLIDGGWSFSSSHPLSMLNLELRGLYLWRKLDISNDTFSEKSKDLIRSLANKEDFAKLKSDILELFNREFPDNSELNIKRVECMEERLKVLQRKMDLKMCEIGEIRLKSQVDAVLAE